MLLSVLDRKWREHLYEMDYLQEGIGLRAMAQRDPLVEYQREGFDMFAAMMDGVKEESVGFLFNLDVEVEADGDEAAARRPPCASRAGAAGGRDRPVEDDDEDARRARSWTSSLLESAQERARRRDQRRLAAHPGQGPGARRRASAG